MRARRPHRPSDRWRRASDGFALPTVLWFVVALALLAAGIARTSHGDQRAARFALDAAQARAAAEAGIARGIMALLGADKSHPWPIDGTAERWSFAGATVEIAIDDELGKVDLNAASELVLRGLFRAEGLAAHEAEILADIVADWRDPTDLKRLNGASREDYRRAGFPYLPRKAPFETVDELGQVMGMTEDLLKQLRPALTVFARRPNPDPGAAPRALRRILQGGPPSAAGGTLDAGAATDASATLRTTSLVLDPTGRAFTITAQARMPGGTTARSSAVVRFRDAARGVFWVHDWR